MIMVRPSAIMPSTWLRVRIASFRDIGPDGLVKCMLLNQANWFMEAALIEFKCSGIRRGLDSASIDLVEYS